MANYDFFMNEDEYGETKGFKIGRALGSALSRIFGGKTSGVIKDKQKKTSVEDKPKIEKSDVNKLDNLITDSGDPFAIPESTNVALDIKGVPDNLKMENYKLPPPIDATGPQDVDYTGGGGLLEGEEEGEEEGGYDPSLDIPDYTGGGTHPNPEDVPPVDATGGGTYNNQGQTDATGPQGVDYTGPQDVDYTGGGTHEILMNIPSGIPNIKTQYLNQKTKTLIGEGLYNTLFGDPNNIDLYEDIPEQGFPPDDSMNEEEDQGGA